MSTSKVIYSGELRTEAEHLSSGQKIITDAPIDNHGKGLAFSPTDLMATSLASCMLTMLGIYATKNSIELKGSHVQITKHMSKEGRRRIVGIDAVVMLQTENELNDTEKSILEDIARNCPVALSLHPEIKQAIQIEFKAK